MMERMTPAAFYQRFSTVILAVAALLVPLIVWGGYWAIRSNSNDVRDWLPPEYVETQQYNWFTDHFGAQDFIVASWPGCTLDDLRLDQFVAELTQRARSAPQGSSVGRIITGRSLLRQLADPPMELDPALSIERLRGVVVGPTGRQTCAAIMLTDEAANHLEPTMELIREAAESAGLPRSEVRLGGIPVVNAALNRESTNSLVRLASLSGLLGLLIAWLCFRDVRLTMLVLTVGIYSAAASLAVVPLVGIPLNAILITMVPLVYVTAVSGAIHLSNYYLDALQHRGPQEAPGHAVAHAAVPLLLAAVTTAIGLLSLGYSDLNPIRLFGVFSAVGVAIGSAAQFLLLPAALVAWKPAAGSRAAEAVSGGSQHGSHLAVWPKLGRWVIMHWPAVLSVCFAGLIAGLIGLPQIRTSIQMMRLFAPGTPVIPMTRWLEEQLGATIPLEVVIRFRPDSGTAEVDRMRLVDAVAQQLRQVPGASGCLSAATFAPPEIRRGAKNAGLFWRNSINAKIRGRLPLLHEYGWVADDGQDELWRISLRVRGIDDLDYAQFAQTLHNTIDPICAAQLGSRRAGVDVTITGTAPIVFKARQSLLEGMLYGLGTDIVLIVVGVLLITRSWATALVMLLMSIFPTAIVFGSMGLLGVVVDIGSVMTPCVAVGVTVDDVIHFLLCHRRGLHQGLTVADATQLAYDTCGRAIVQSWGIIGIGLAAFALSSFVPTFRFGMLMLLLLTAGMLGNLLFLPALLAGPIGRWLRKSVAAKPDDDSATPDVAV